MRWGGSLLEEARLHGSPALLTVAPHAVAADAAGDADVELVPAAADATRQRCPSASRPSTAGVSLADADVVVSGGRGVGSAEGFAVIEELAALLGAAVGCSRAVTSAGWRPHTDQVGQTGTKISPAIYIACGISGATQHMAGCKGAKKLLAINPDGEASIFASADYAVIGDLHEVVPAICAEIRKARGGDSLAGRRRWRWPPPSPSAARCSHAASACSRGSYRRRAPTQRTRRRAAPRSQRGRRSCSGSASCSSGSARG